MVTTDKLFIGQRLDSTGLYFYGARYYDPAIGRFISPDTIVPDPASPQSFNRYSYCLNNPLKYTDQSGQGMDYMTNLEKIIRTQHLSPSELRIAQNLYFDLQDAVLGALFP